MISPVIVILLGISGWVIAFILALAVDANANTYWICAVGFGLGLLGLRYTIRRGKREEL